MGNEIKAFETVCKAIVLATGEPFRAERVCSVGGGCINEAYRLEGDNQQYFVKTNHPSMHEMFTAEAAGLEELAAPGAVRVPGVIALGSDDRAWLVLEYIELGNPGVASHRLLGEQLAALHHTTAKRFGWFRDNTIGATLQPNGWWKEWPAFLAQQRLGHQLKLAATNGAEAGLIDAGERLLERLNEFFTGYSPAPSLVHGDLWGGNWAADRDGCPVIFDPAVYYGDRETDLAMTELFGGFSPTFYDAYQATWPLDPGYRLRRELYQLYHLLNHYNIFRGAYASQAQSAIKKLLAQTGHE